MKWENFNIKQTVITNLNEQKISKPLPVQSKVVPLILKNTNIVVASNTGSGKTHAFLVPLLSKVVDNINQTQALIFAPTRELAQQIYQFAKTLVKNTNIKVACFTGGKAIKQQASKINSKIPHLIIGTVARIKKLYESNLLDLATVNMLVIDECDMIFELGFFEDLEFLWSKMRKKCQIMVFSATIKQELQIFLKKYFNNIKIIDFKINKQVLSITHNFIETKIEKRMTDFHQLITAINPYLCIIFVNNKNNINEITTLLKNEGKSFTILHGDIALRSKMQIIKNIKNLAFQYVVATDIFARGIDILQVSDIISLDLPQHLEYYWHRAGRTGRNGASGTSYVFYTPENNEQIVILKNQGLKINYYKLKNKELVVSNTNLTLIKSSNNVLNKNQIRLINQFKKTKVKPGYRQKLKKQLKPERKK